MRNLLSILMMSLICMLSVVFADDRNELDALLNKGEVVTETIQDESNTPGIRASFLIEAGRDKIWSALVDYENFTKIFSGIDQMEVLEDNIGGAIVEFVITVAFMEFNYTLSREYTRPGYLLTWKRLAGDFKKIQGSWQIIDTHDPKKKLVIYESYVDVGSDILTSVTRFIANQKAKSMALQFRNWVKNIEEEESDSSVIDAR